MNSKKDLTLENFNKAYEGYEKLLSELIKDGKTFMKICLDILREHIESEIKKQQDWAKGKSEYKDEKLDVNFDVLRKAAVDYIKKYLQNELIKDADDVCEEYQKILYDGISKTTNNKAYCEHLKSWVPILTKKVLILCGDKNKKMNKAKQQVDQYLKDHPILDKAGLELPRSIQQKMGFGTPSAVIIDYAFNETAYERQPKLKDYKEKVLDSHVNRIRMLLQNP